VRGLDRQVIFRDDRDREAYLARLQGLAAHDAPTVLAWAVLPNHAHLLVRIGTRSLAATLGVPPQSVSHAAQRGREAAVEWRKCLTK